MESNIQIVEKPDWVTWDDIKQCLFEVHAVNRSKGINMTHYQWPAEKIKEFIGEQGTILVALDGNKLIGSAAIKEGSKSHWYVSGKYAFVCFDGVMPEYSGQGIFRLLDSKREDKAKELGYDVLVFDTHEKNTYRQRIALKNGYRYVRYSLVSTKDHFNVVMAKWLNGCPYSERFCKWKYFISKLQTKLKAKLF